MLKFFRNEQHAIVFLWTKKYMQIRFTLRCIQ